MDLELLSPLAALVGLLVLAPVLALLAARRRSARLAGALGLAPATWTADAAPLLAVALTGGLLALAAAQPVASSVQPVEARADAEAIVVLDITRSMEARERRGAPTRFQRALAAAKLVRAAIPDVPVGAASLSDRLLPHLFPSASANAFNATLDRAVGVERPPPDRLGRGKVTSLAALSALVTQNFYGRGARRRVAVVLTDGETLPFDLGTLRGRLLGRVATVFVHVWRPDERVFGAGGVPERAYRPDPDSRRILETAAEAVGGGAFGEDDLDAAASAVRRAIGTGPTVESGRELRSRELAPHAALAAAVPLLFLLWRRNAAA